MSHYKRLFYFVLGKLELDEMPNCLLRFYFFSLPWFFVLFFLDIICDKKVCKDGYSLYDLHST